MRGCNIFNVVKLALTSISMLLSACASNPPATLDHNTLHLSGRFSMHNQNNTLHGNFDWVQINTPNSIHAPAKTKVTLLSPLGQTLAIIDITPQTSTLIQAGRAPRMAADADALAAQVLGWPLPVSGLRNWLQGYAIHSDGTHFIATPTNNIVTTQDGWRIHYVSWEQNEKIENTMNTIHYRPKRIDLARNIPAIGEVAIRLIIDSWQ